MACSFWVFSSSSVSLCLLRNLLVDFFHFFGRVRLCVWNIQLDFVGSLLAPLLYINIHEMASLQKFELSEWFLYLSHFSFALHESLLCNNFAYLFALL